MNKPIIEATCVVDGVEYHAETRPFPGMWARCTGCAGKDDTDTCWDSGPCSEDDRADRSDIIWVPA
jgi:hypothetical protein